MEILIDFLGHFTLGVIIGSVIAIIVIKLYKTFKNK
jgi:multisubunit Na+/H+ antiporter MnhB subunit